MSEVTLRIPSLLEKSVELGASDIHIKSNKPAMVRLRGSLIPIEGCEPITPEEIAQFIEHTTKGTFREQWDRDLQVDYAYFLESGSRFRVNGFHQRTLPGLVFRRVNDRPPSFADLNMEDDLFRDLSKYKDGIILICGATGAGKSSTLAAFLEMLNQERNLHIVTLEDPIEYVYTDKKSIINQREVGIDINSFQDGLRAVLRQDPDVILIGEMRDRATFEIAMRAAETGHLVLSTLHAAHTQQAVRRLFEFFPPEQQAMMYRQVSEALRCSIVQKLVPNLEKNGRVPAMEVMVNDPSVRKLLQEGHFEKLYSALEAGKDSGSRTFNGDLFRLYKEGRISKEDALTFSPNAKQLEMNMKGIFLSSGGLVG